MKMLILGAYRKYMCGVYGCRDVYNCGAVVGSNPTIDNKITIFPKVVVCGCELIY